MKTMKSLIFCLIFILGVSSFAKAAPLSEVQSTILYVREGVTGDCFSWATACDLQTALLNAIPGDQVWVAAGIYKPTTTDPYPRDATFELKTGVAIYGGFPALGGTLEQRDWATNLTTLSGDIGIVGNIDDNSYHVVTGNGVDGTAIMDGFTISGGNANGNDSYIYGGGMYNDLGSPTLTNVTFSGNSAYSGGGMYNNYSSPKLTNVTFTENSATYDGGGMYNLFDSNPTLTNVTFSGNSAAYYGGGMYNYDSSPALTNVTFSANPASYGGGMYNDSSNPTLTNITFSSNSATYDGGGMYNDSSNPTLTNVTFSSNSATYDGGGMFNNYSGPTLTNAIVWGNTPDQIYNTGGGSATITYSDIQGGGYSDPSNIITDPLLGLLANNGGFTQTRALGYGSPAIDAGDPAVCTATDQRGYPRPIDGDGNGSKICDMGAYEYYHTVYLPIILK